MEKTRIVQIASNSIEDFSEYADAEESVSAPTELFAEFLHSIMVKDYEKALIYCNQILTYEPDYTIVKEFRPIIEEKLEMLRNEESEDNSSNSSLSFSSSTSSSSDNLHSTKDQKVWEARNLNCSSLENDTENKKTPRIRKSGNSQSDMTNGNPEIHCSPTAEDFIRGKDSKKISTTETRTLINANLLAHVTRTRILRPERAEHDHKGSGIFKIENSATLLHPTDTRVLTKGFSLAPAKDNSKTFAWFSSLQENLFGSKKPENSRLKKSVQNIENINNAKGKDTLKSVKKQTST